MGGAISSSATANTGLQARMIPNAPQSNGPGGSSSPIPLTALDPGTAIGTSASIFHTALDSPRRGTDNSILASSSSPSFHTGKMSSATSYSDSKGTSVEHENTSIASSLLQPWESSVDIDPTAQNSISLPVDQFKPLAISTPVKSMPSVPGTSTDSAPVHLTKVAASVSSGSNDLSTAETSIGALPETGGADTDPLNRSVGDASTEFRTANTNSDAQLSSTTNVDPADQSTNMFQETFLPREISTTPHIY